MDYLLVIFSMVIGYVVGHSYRDVKEAIKELQADKTVIEVGVVNVKSPIKQSLASDNEQSGILSIKTPRQLYEEEEQEINRL